MTHEELDDLYTVREVRELSGLSRQQVADLLELSRNQYGYIERGERNFTLKTATTWLNAMLTRLDEVYATGEVDVEWGRVPGFHDLLTYNAYEGTD